MQNDKSYFTHGNFESNPPSTVNTAKFDCLDLSGPHCTSKIIFEYCSIVNRLHLIQKKFSPSALDICKITKNLVPEHMRHDVEPKRKAYWTHANNRYKWLLHDAPSKLHHALQMSIVITHAQLSGKVCCITDYISGLIISRAIYLDWTTWGKIYITISASDEGELWFFCIQNHLDK